MQPVFTIPTASGIAGAAGSGIGQMLYGDSGKIVGTTVMFDPTAGGGLGAFGLTGLPGGRAVFDISGILGSNLVTNGTFDADLTGWGGSGWSWNAGKALHTPGDATPLTFTGGTAVIGTLYKITYVVTRSAGSLRVAIGGAEGVVRSSGSTFTDYLYATTTAGFRVIPSPDFNGTIDTIVVKANSYGTGVFDGDVQAYGKLSVGSQINLANNKLSIANLNQVHFSRPLGDDDTLSLPAVTNSAFGIAIAGNNEEYGLFLIDNDGDVTLLVNSGNVVSGADTDAKFCIGTAATQEPLVIKNRLGGEKNINLMLWYN